MVSEQDLPCRTIQFPTISVTFLPLIGHCCCVVYLVSDYISFDLLSEQLTCFLGVSSLSRFIWASLLFLPGHWPIKERLLIYLLYPSFEASDIATAWTRVQCIKFSCGTNVYYQNRVSHCSCVNLMVCKDWLETCNLPSAGTGEDVSEALLGVEPCW